GEYLTAVLTEPTGPARVIIQALGWADPIVLVCIGLILVYRSRKAYDWWPQGFPLALLAAFGLIPAFIDFSFPDQLMSAVELATVFAICVQLAINLLAMSRSARAPDPGRSGGTAVIGRFVLSPAVTLLVGIVALAYAAADQSLWFVGAGWLLTAIGGFLLVV